MRPRVHKTVVAVAVAPDAARRNGAAPVAVLPTPLPAHGTPLLVLFGSNLGTSEDAARRVADLASAQGFAVRVAWLDDFVGKLPAEGGVLIVCASYNGAPPDNAAAFYQWLADGLAPDALAGVHYAVFGCGNRNWASTYQAVPRFIDERLAAYGATRLFERGEGDAQEDLDGQFRAWRLALWQSVAKDLGISFDAQAETGSRPRYAVEVVAGPQANPLAAVHGAGAMQILVNRELQTSGGRSTRHIEVALPAGTTYGIGDHLGVVAENPPSRRRTRVASVSASPATPTCGCAPSRRCRRRSQPIRRSRRSGFWRTMSNSSTPRRASRSPRWPSTRSARTRSRGCWRLRPATRRSAHTEPR